MPKRRKPQPKTKPAPASSEAPASDANHYLRDAQSVSSLLIRAADANRQTTGRKGATIHLPSRGQLLITGDLHDHALNLQRILKLAALDQSPNHFLILHEIIHGPYRINGCDMSIRTLAQIAALKLQYPDQVHVLQANHELAQLRNEGILKGGVNVVEAFDLGLEFIYADEAPLVRNAMYQYIQSLPLAAKSAHGLFFSHSLPSARLLGKFDTDVIHRWPTESDLAIDGHGYNMVWGRRHTKKVADVLGKAWGANQFIIGHQPAEMGYETQGDRMLVMASNHEHGIAIPIDLSKTYDQPSLLEQIVPLPSIIV